MKNTIQNMKNKLQPIILLAFVLVIYSCESQESKEIDESKYETHLYNNKNSGNEEMNPLLKAAEDFLTAGEYKKAIEKFNESDSTYGFNSISISDKGLCYTKLDDYETALKINNSFVEYYPNDPASWSNRGMTYIRLNKFELALKDFNKSIELDPKEAGLYFNRYFAYINIGDKQKACEDLSTALDLGFTKKYGSSAQEEFNATCK